jgi:hypothetical protein
MREFVQAVMSPDMWDKNRANQDILSDVVAIRDSEQFENFPVANGTIVLKDVPNTVLCTV